jgi:hypothetical protein
VNPHDVITQARQEPCTCCGTQPPALCQPGAVHACRACRAYCAGLITYRELTGVMGGGHDGRSLLYDPPEVQT